MIEDDALIDFGLGIKPDGIIEKLPDIVDWAEDNFFIETGRPIVLEPHQKRLLRLISQQRPDGVFVWRNVLYSTIKKSGKTTISALYARWASETWGPYQEIYNLGNKLKQAKERAFKMIDRSIKLAPSKIRDQWDLQATRLTHLPSGSFIEALPISGAGEAGGNQSLTVWTELWGFQYEDALLMWDELKPVLTRPLSQRYVDTYAGFNDISLLLKGIWDAGLRGERLDDELPIYGNESAGLIAYIDTGEEARRMPWQQGEEGRKYYIEEEETEREESFRRHHLNLWADSVETLIDIDLWDSLKVDGSEPAPGEEVVIACDASVNHDCMAMCITGYNRQADLIYELQTDIWTPPEGGTLDYEITIEKELLRAIRQRRVRMIGYDPYQLHDLMTRLSKKYKHITFYAFPQGGERLKADSALVTRIEQGNIRHSGSVELRTHIKNADGKKVGDNALRIVKRKEDGMPIDAAVALSMSSWCWHEVKPKPNLPKSRQVKTGFWGGRR